MSVPVDETIAIDRTLVRDLAELLKETDLSEIEVETKGLRIRVSRTLVAAPALSYAVAPPQMVPGAAPGTAAAGIAGGRGGDMAEAGRNANAVPSPMVGTAYLSPEPGARPFVEIGGNVVEGQTILIIEAMKHMNEVPAPRAGKVTSILVSDGQPVEYGEPLIVIE